MEPVAWGILGVSGHFLLRVATPIKKSKLVSLRAIGSRSAEKARAAAEAHGIAAWYGSYEEVLQDEAVEAVFIPLPNHMHTEWIRKAADAGKHILCEKPLALDAADAADAIQYAKSKGVLVMEAFMYRFHPQWVRVAEIVRCGEIGKVHAVHSFFSYMNKDPQNIRNQLEAGGGALLDIGCYTVSVPRLVMGREPVRVVSLVARDPGFGTDILSSGILDFGDNSRALFTVGTQTFPHQRVDVYGSNGTITVYVPFNMYPDVPAKVTVRTGVGTRDILLGPEDQYGLMFDAFSRAIREGKPEPTDPADAINNQKVLDALFRSEKSGTWEPVQ